MLKAFCSKNNDHVRAPFFFEICKLQAGVFLSIFIEEYTSLSAKPRIARRTRG